MELCEAGCSRGHPSAGVDDGAGMDEVPGWKLGFENPVQAKSQTKNQPLDVALLLPEHRNTKLMVGMVGSNLEQLSVQNRHHPALGRRPG